MLTTKQNSQEIQHFHTKNTHWPISSACCKASAPEDATLNLGTLTPASRSRPMLRYSWRDRWRFCCWEEAGESAGAPAATTCLKQNFCVRSTLTGSSYLVKSVPNAKKKKKKKKAWIYFNSSFFFSPPHRKVHKTNKNTVTQTKTAKTLIKDTSYTPTNYWTYLKKN